MKMFKRRIGHPHQFYELGFDCLARCSSCTRRRIECRPWSYHFFLSTDMTDPTTRIKTNSTTSIVKKNKEKQYELFPAVATGAWVKSKHDMYLIRSSVGA